MIQKIIDKSHYGKLLSEQENSNLIFSGQKPDRTQEPPVTETKGKREPSVSDFTKRHNGSLRMAHHNSLHRPESKYHI